MKNYHCVIYQDKSNYELWILYKVCVCVCVCVCVVSDKKNTSEESRYGNVTENIFPVNLYLK